MQLLYDDLRERPQDLSLHARLHKLLLAEGSTPRIEDHTEKYLELLVKSQNWREALDLVGEALARRADWSPRPVEIYCPTGARCAAEGQAAASGGPDSGFDKKYPNHPDIPQIY